MINIFCPTCGRILSYEPAHPLTFCTYCGNRLSDQPNSHGGMNPCPGFSQTNTSVMGKSGPAFVNGFKSYYSDARDNYNGGRYAHAVICCNAQLRMSPDAVENADTLLYKAEALAALSSVEHNYILEAAATLDLAHAADADAGRMSQALLKVTAGLDALIPQLKKELKKYGPSTARVHGVFPLYWAIGYTAFSVGDASLPSIRLSCEKAMREIGRLTHGAAKEYYENRPYNYYFAAPKRFRADYKKSSDPEKMELKSFANAFLVKDYNEFSRSSDYRKALADMRRIGPI